MQHLIFNYLQNLTTNPITKTKAHPLRKTALYSSGANVDIITIEEGEGENNDYNNSRNRSGNNEYSSSRNRSHGNRASSPFRDRVQERLVFK